MNEQLKSDRLHKIPADLLDLLDSNRRLVAAWGKITPLARNEWVCWIESAKKIETRSHRMRRARQELVEGKRRPCCWAGCPHRKFKNL